MSNTQGVIIDNKLSWVNHIDHVNIKLSKEIGLLARLRQFVSENTLKNLYNVLIQPHIDYELILWGNALDAHSHKISVNLNTAVRIMQFKNRHESAGPLFKQFKFSTYIFTSQHAHVKRNNFEITN